MQRAIGYIGQREIPGREHNALIVQWWRAIRRGGIRDDETPWCAAFVGACLEEVGIRSSRFESAASYLAWGQHLMRPAPGCIVVLSRSGGGGHVGFLAGADVLGNLLILGGNQGNAVNVAAFPMTRVQGLRWPEGWPLPAPGAPLTLASAPASTSEA
jgi:uncharacterized protein (TIGR02594 family)